MDYTILLASLAALLAGFIDAVVGGGGLVQVPSLFILYPHFVVPQVIGTNRFASFMGTSVAAYQYAKKVTMPWKVILATGIGAAICSYLGATVSSLVPANILKPIMLVVMIGIAAYTYKNKNFGQTDNLQFNPTQLLIYGALVGMCLGFYNGFIGPGTGSLLVFAFVSVLGYSLLNASGIAKVINVVADVSSLIFFIAGGYVQYEIAIPMMICNMLGSYFGSRMAILKGSIFIRMMFIGVIGLLILRFGYDVLKPLWVTSHH